MLKGFLEYLSQGTPGCRSLSSLPFGCFSSPTNVRTPAATYSHSTSTALHSICFM